LEDAHHGSVNAGCIAGSKRHYIKAILEQVRGEKCELLAVSRVDSDLVETGAAARRINQS